ncbi:hypothetical protein AAV99_05370 [Aurantiacibacter marinus]|uniref:BLUF domain-containing protein n=2 Tax=Aurantiacibacter marinus TaxID=874156 RepID=A0A0H0XY68_9SPHN|nr:hypothetical protein AAV99_05370 [Aurantiacibacter marinus]
MLAGILLQARRNNKRDEITGALICRQDMYLQLVEGPAAAIDDLYLNITADDRHCEGTLAYSATVDHRLFPDWEMLDDSMPGVTFSCEGITGSEIGDASPEALLAVFEQIAAKARN